MHWPLDLVSTLVTHVTGSALSEESFVCLSRLNLSVISRHNTCGHTYCLLQIDANLATEGFSLPE